MGGVPELRFPEFSGEWKEVRLGEISTKPKYGINAPSVPYSVNLPRYLRITDIDDEGKYNAGNKVSVDDDSSADYILKDGDIVFARTGATVGKSYLYDSDDGSLVYAGYLIKFSIDTSQAIPRIISLCAQTNKYWKWVKATSMRSGQPGINGKEYALLKLNLPSLPEQQKIADFLTAIDEKIAILTDKITQLETYKKGMMQKLLSGELRFPGFTDVWREVKLREIAEKKTIKNTANIISLVLTNSATQGIVSQRDYFDKDIANADNLAGYYIVDKGDFVYNPRISVHAPVGPIKRNHLSKGVMSPLYTVFRLQDGNLTFYEHYFNTTHWYRYMKSIANYGARYDRMNIKDSDFFKMPLPFPSLPEQQKIADFLTAIDDKLTIEQEKLDQLKHYKQGLLQKMFV